MSSIKKMFVIAALAVSTLAPAASSYAMSMPAPAQAVEQKTDVTDVAWRRVCNNRRCRRVWVGPRVVVRQRVIVRRPIIVRRPVIIRPRIIVRQPVVIRNAGNAHVNWCLDRYQSYDPRTDTFLGYDGLYHRCISPY